MTLSKRICLLVGILAVGVLGFMVSSPAVVQSLRIGHFVKVSEKDVGRGYVEYTYRADVTNLGHRRMSDVEATVRSRSHHTIVVDGRLSFGEVPARKTVTSRDTFTIRSHRHHHHPTQLNDLVWTVSGKVANSPPLADAGPDQTVSPWSRVTLDGGRSSDPDGDHLSFRWAFVSVPSGSKAHLSNHHRVRPTFFADLPGTYVVQLIVRDRRASSAPDTVIISTHNSAPVADAGDNQTVALGDTVTLDGSRSSDVDGDELTFNWSFVSRPNGSAAVLSGQSDVKPSFQADKPGSYVAQLVVNDGTKNSAPATVTVTTQNTMPVANAGSGQTVFVGDLVTLDGSKSTDVDGDTLTFEWSFTSIPEGSTAVLSGTSDVRPTFEVDKSGIYVAQLIVDDGKTSSAPATVTITTRNSKPIANAGPDQTVLVGDLVLLDAGKSSDVDGDQLSYRWSLSSRPEGSGAVLSDTAAVRPTFTADVPGSYTAQLIVNDGTSDSAPASVTIITRNSRPVADAGPPQTVFVGNTVILDGSQSKDADGDPLSYRWAILSRPMGSNAALSNPFDVKPALEADMPGTYSVQLIVNDGALDSAPSTVTISTRNSRPVARAGAAQTVSAGASVSLDGTGSSDADHDPLTYNWALISLPQGSGARLSDANIAAPSFAADLAGTYVVQLIVFDGKVNSDPDTVVITSLAPLACSITAAPLEGFVPFEVQFAASVTGGLPPYSCQWNLSDNGSVSSADPAFSHVFKNPGSYPVTLNVSDSLGGKATASVFISALLQNENPVSDPGGPYTGRVGSPVQFDGAGSSDPDNDLLSYTWNFGDGATGSGARPVHVYTASGAFTVALTVQDGRGGSHTATTSITIVPPPSISGMSVTSGPVGTVVILSGSGFDAGGARVAFNGVTAFISSLTGTSITTTVPMGAATGPVSVTTAGGVATAPSDFVVTPMHDFNLSVNPLQATAAVQSQVIYTVRATGDDEYSGLIALEVRGMPEGFSGFFTPAAIAPGQTSTLTVTTCDCEMTGPAAITIAGSAGIGGKEVTRSAVVSLGLLQPGVTTLVGRVVDTAGSPIENVVISVDQSATATDTAGNFVLQNPPTGDRVVLIDGFPASTENAKYPSIPITMSIVEGRTNYLPYVPHFHAQKNFNFTPINPAQETIVEDPNLPNFQLRIPPGVDIIGWDGQPNAIVSVRRVPMDSLPIPTPPADLQIKSIYMFYFGKRGGGVPTIPIPVTTPNDLELSPGEKADLWYFNESTDINEAPNDWSFAGTGTVSADGQTISTDPGVGIPRFCCGAIAYAPRRETGDNINPSGCKLGDPVDMATGVFIHSVTDLAIPGRIPIAVNRTHRSRDTIRGPFGPGTYLGYDWFLLRSGDMATLVIPPGTRIPFTRDRDGRFTNKTMPSYRGAVVTINEDSTGLLKMKDGTSYRFEANGLLCEQADRNGNKLTFLRNRYTDLIGIKGSDDKVMVQFGLVIASRDIIVNLTDIAGRKVTYTYEAGALTSVTDQAGGVTRYEYDGGKRITAIIDPEGNATVRNYYDANGRVCRQEHANGGVWKYEYITASDSTRAGAPNPAGQPVSARQDVELLQNYNASDDSCSAAATKSTVVATIMTDPNGNRTLFRFDGAGFITRVTDALGQSTSYERDTATNQLLSSTDSLGRVTRYAYDENGNTISVTDPAGNITRYDYTSAFNQLAKITDALGNVTAFDYDSRGNLVKAANPLGNSVAISYDDRGQPVSVTDPLGHTTGFEYDDSGNLISVIDPMGNRSTRAYDAVARLIQATDPNGKSAGFTYDPMNRITSITDSLNNLTQFSYNGNGNLLSVTDAKGNSVSYTYDVTGRVETMKDPLGAVETYGRDPGGNLTMVVDRKGQTTTFGYDALNRKISAVYADGGTVRYRYDAVGRLMEVDDSESGTIAWEYATFGQCQGCSGRSLDKIIQETTPMGTIHYTYDALGRRTSMTAAGDARVNYGYDAGSRLTEIDRSDLGTVGIGYDAANRRISLSLPNGVSTEYGYDASSRLLGMTHKNVSGTIESLNYVTDPAGNRISLQSLIPRTELPEAATAAYDAANRLLTFNDRNFIYDPNGNMVEKREAAGTTFYTWDARNRLVSIDGPQVSARFKYDAFNRRIEKSVNNKATQYQYDGKDIIAEMEEGLVSARYQRGLSLDEPFARMDKNGVRFYTADGLGSTIALTDETGAVKTQYLYGPYGGTTPVGDPSGNPFQYTGRENDGTGLYYYRARYYDPLLGRFISEDPIGFGGGDVNLFGYVRNNPVNLIDPFGLAPGNDPDRGQWGPVTNAVADFIKNYQDMREANTIGADKYFHCMANCQSAKEGPLGKGIAQALGEGRELLDEHLKGDPPSACDEDRAANRLGREGDPSVPCRNTCDSLRPRGLDPKY